MYRRGYLWPILYYPIWCVATKNKGHFRNNILIFEEIGGERVGGFWGHASKIHAGFRGTPMGLMDFLVMVEFSQV